MSFADQHSQSPALKPIIGVALVHVAIGYALASGLAYEAMQHVPAVFRVVNIAIPDAPPPEPLPEPLPQPKSMPAKRVTAAEPAVALPQSPPVMPSPVPMLDPPVAGAVKLPLTPPAPPATRTATEAHAKGDRSQWISSDDYPARALRQGRKAVSP